MCPAIFLFDFISFFFINHFYYQKKYAFTKKQIKICSISAYATLSSRLNLSALSILLKELYKIDNKFDNTRFRKKHGTVEAITGSRTFFNSLSFKLRFRILNSTHNLHVRIFTTGTVHIAGASDYDVTMKRAFQLICGIVACCHEYDKHVEIVGNADTFGLRNMRVAMLHTIYNHNKCIDREMLTSILQKHDRNVRYDPDLHNAVNVRFLNNNGAFLIFKSGKILITGCKDMDICANELEQLLPYFLDL